MEEIWKDIFGYEGLYQVSNKGKIKSLTPDKKISCGRNSSKKEKILSLQNNDGYKSVKLSKNKKSKRFRVHRLVAEAFLPNPKNKLFINHKDFNRINNCVENLEWVTSRENRTHYCNSIKTQSNFTGVFLDKRDNVYFSSIRNKNKRINLGRFKTEIEAHNAYQKALKKIELEEDLKKYKSL